jgi:hypothetical protein
MLILWSQIGPFTLDRWGGKPDPRFASTGKIEEKVRIKN